MSGYSSYLGAVLLFVRFRFHDSYISASRGAPLYCALSPPQYLILSFAHPSERSPLSLTLQAFCATARALPGSGDPVVGLRHRCTEMYIGASVYRVVHTILDSTDMSIRYSYHVEYRTLGRSSGISVWICTNMPIHGHTAIG